MHCTYLHCIYTTLHVKYLYTALQVLVQHCKHVYITACTCTTRNVLVHLYSLNPFTCTACVQHCMYSTVLDELAQHCMHSYFSMCTVLHARLRTCTAYVNSTACIVVYNVQHCMYIVINSVKWGLHLSDINSRHYISPLLFTLTQPCHTATHPVILFTQNFPPTLWQIFVEQNTVTMMVCSPKSTFKCKWKLFRVFSSMNPK